MSAAKNFGLGHSEFPVTETLLVRVTFSDSKVQNPLIAPETAAKHLEAAAAQIRQEAAEAARKPAVAKPSTK